MPITDQLFYYLIYTLVWGSLYLLLGLFKEHHLLRTPFQRINSVSAIHYATVTPLFAIALLQTAEPFGYDLRAPLLVKHGMLMTVGYFIVAVAHSFSTGEKEKTGLIHHFFFFLIHIILLTWGEFPRFWMWVMVAQAPGILFHPMLVISKSEKVPKTILLALEKLHLKVYIAFRLVYQNIFGILIIIFDYAGQVSPPWAYWGLVVPVIFFSSYLNWIWYKQAKKHLQKTKSKTLGISN